MAENQVELEMFRCNDMALVSYLRVNGQQPQDSYWDSDGQTVYWEFYILPTTVKLMEDFNTDKALVEPKAYNRAFQQSKKEMYAQLDQHRR